VTSHIFPSPANQNKSLKEEKHKRHRHRDWSGATVGAIIGFAGLFCARLGHIWIGFDIFAQFWMQFFFIVLACCLGLVSPKYKTLVAIILLALMVAGYSAWPQYISSGAAPALKPLQANEKILKVASFNSYAGNKTPAAIAREILRLDPDVMVLVEFENSNAASLDALRQKYPYQETCWQLNDCDFAILSKTPITDVSAKVGWAGPSFMSVKMGVEFGNVTIIGLHMIRFPHQRTQLNQTLAFIKFMESVPGRVVLMGDFNATPFSRITQTVSDGLAFERLTYLPTWSATYGLPQLAIDHIFVSPGIRALDHERIGEYAGSDHFPITITLGIPAK
jgi:endonuclease/exonuclease/phosphatase (EEP) superfamily protein YafD